MIDIHLDKARKRLGHRFKSYLDFTPLLEIYWDDFDSREMLMPKYLIYILFFFLDQFLL